MALLDPEEQNIVRRSVLQRMSTKQVKEVGDIVSEEFSPQVFVTAWGKMSPQAKNALFGEKKNNSGATLKKLLIFLKCLLVQVKS